MATKAHDEAFPLNIPGNRYNEGMTKREFFAAMAMQGMVANDMDPQEIAEEAVEQADALITALNTV